MTDYLNLNNAYVIENYNRLPFMSKKQINTFKKYLLKCNSYFEFGSGGSTFFAIDNNVKLIESVESDKDWYNNLIKEDSIRNKITNNTIKINFIDLNSKPNNWGYPSKNTKDSWHLYYESILNNSFSPDLILIDGRFRVECVLMSILYIVNNNKYDTIILFDDYFKYSRYHVISTFINLLERSDKMAVFKIKTNINNNHLENLISKYKYIPEEYYQ